MANKVIAYLALGSNVGDRMAFLTKAREALIKSKKIEIIKSSKIYETEPWPRNKLPNDHPHEEGGQKWFLNQVIEIETTLSPQELIQEAGAIEERIGRIVRGSWGAREIDIDILLYAGEIMDTPDLQIPHRHIQDRQFVLVPLVEIAPDLIDPMTHRKFSDMLEEIKIRDDHKVIPFL
ncbi:2-amino-4-hydroxy-6-hydroxymethyldihydropteridine diphosphokinase [Candidatus Peregrinibacteria bacterium]|nr:2-amino-4-hydroxy-6-hydroxymethyldihydropteridine diphosphokinase [Candidatus Peregrinibacteria bacterium]